MLTDDLLRHLSDEEKALVETAVHALPQWEAGNERVFISPVLVLSLLERLAVRTAALTDEANVLADLVLGWAEHDDMKRGCQGETCPYCFALIAKERIVAALAAPTQEDDRE